MTKRAVAGGDVAVPYFLAAGNHVSQDIPAELECARAGSAHVKIELAQYLGANQAMAEMVLACSKQSA
ncbi:MAG: hypothetical protein GY875_14025 [Gammaproteobacteria bacterium]|nr:hypothetical protein [Gammaproteobacteria bacterium]